MLKEIEIRSRVFRYQTPDDNGGGGSSHPLTTTEKSTVVSLADLMNSNPAVISENEAQAKRAQHRAAGRVSVDPPGQNRSNMVVDQLRNRRNGM